MTKTFKLTAILIASMLVFGTSCKYENGPSISLRTKKARMANTWELTEAVDGDTDISEFTKGIEITMDKDGNYTTGGETKQGPVTETKGIWEFSADKTQVILTQDGQTVADKWTITKLKNDELWLEKDQANGTKASQKFKGLD